MRNLNLIHLNGLRAVEAVGRLGTLKSAAEELGVSVGAISQHLRKVEEQLGRKLFHRHQKGLVLTDAGARALPHLSTGMLELSKSIDRVMGCAGDPLVVTAAPVFASKWLVTRLSRFSEAHPSLRVRLEATPELVDPHSTDVDICIRVGKGPWPGLDAIKLMDQFVFPVCSAETAKHIAGPEDIAKVPIIVDRYSMIRWTDWLAPAGLDHLALSVGPTFSDASLCLDAAISGQGLFLAWEALAFDALDCGRLVEPFQGRHPTGLAYWFLVRPGDMRRQPLADFEAWLRAELARSLRRDDDRHQAVVV